MYTRLFTLRSNTKKENLKNTIEIEKALSKEKISVEELSTLLIKNMSDDDSGKSIKSYSAAKKLLINEEIINMKKNTTWNHYTKKKIKEISFNLINQNQHDEFKYENQLYRALNSGLVTETLNILKEHPNLIDHEFFVILFNTLAQRRTFTYSLQIRE